MRKGQNPARQGMLAYHPLALGIASLVYIPDTGGYFEQALQVLRLQVTSLRKNTHRPFDFLVFDNGSCPEVKAELQRMLQEGWIDWLVVSRHNLGKTGAINWIFSSMPNEWICYTDSDILFRDGWDEASFQMFSSFPNVGLVTAQPCFSDVLNGTGQAHEILVQDAKYLHEDWIPSDAVVEEYCRGLGDLPGMIQRLRGKALSRVTNSQTGVQAVIGASHMQFMARRAVIQAVLPLPAEKAISPEEDRVLDQRVDQAGYLHLSTPQPYVVHIGNTFDPSLPELKEYQEAQQHLPANPQKRRAGQEKPWLYHVLAHFARRGLFKPLFRRLYNALFQIYSSQ